MLIDQYSRNTWSSRYSSVVEHMLCVCRRLGLVLGIAMGNQTTFI